MLFIGHKIDDSNLLSQELWPIANHKVFSFVYVDATQNISAEHCNSRLDAIKERERDIMGLGMVFVGKQPISCPGSYKKAPSKRSYSGPLPQNTSSRGILIVTYCFSYRKIVIWFLQQGKAILRVGRFVKLTCSLPNYICYGKLRSEARNIHQ
jgi:hypothetical protein